MGGQSVKQEIEPIRVQHASHVEPATRLALLRLRARPPYEKAMRLWWPPWASTSHVYPAICPASPTPG